MSSHEKKLALLNNILTAFEAAPKQAVRGANPATTIAEKAQVTVGGVTVEVFHSKVTVTPWSTVEYLTISVPTVPELSGSMEIFRAEGNGNGQWWRIRTSPLALLLFGQQQQQQQPQRFTTVPVAVPA